MSRIGNISAEEIIGFLAYQGFEKKRQKGSHIFYKHPDGRTVTVPFHKGESLGKGILVKILRDIKSDKEKLLTWIESTK
jgi:predicted RNA binding protein YcfA (HicA-like mRNA interferase family)